MIASRFDCRLLSVCAVFAALLCGCGTFTATAPVQSFGQGHIRRDGGTYGNCPEVPGGTGILLDGDFSQASNPGAHNITSQKGTFFAPAWKVWRGNIDFNGTTYWEMDGLCSVDLDGDLTVGGIKSSAFKPMPGRYALSFVMSGNGHCPPLVKNMKIGIDNQVTHFTWNTSGGYDVQDGDYTIEKWQIKLKRLSALKILSEDPLGSGCGIVIAGISIKRI